MGTTEPRLIALGKSYREDKSNSNYRIDVRCRICGEEKTVWYSNFKSQNVSCGCIKKGRRTLHRNLDRSNKGRFQSARVKAQTNPDKRVRTGK